MIQIQNPYLYFQRRKTIGFGNPFLIRCFRKIKLKKHKISKSHRLKYKEPINRNFKMVFKITERKKHGVKRKK